MNDEKDSLVLSGQLLVSLAERESFISLLLNALNKFDEIIDFFWSVKEIDGGLHHVIMLESFEEAIAFYSHIKMGFFEEFEPRSLLWGITYLTV